MNRLETDEDPVTAYLSAGFDCWASEPRLRLVQLPDMVFSTALTVGSGAPNPGPRLSRSVSMPSGSKPPTDLSVIDLLTTEPGTGTPFGLMSWWASRVPEVPVGVSAGPLLAVFSGLDAWRGITESLYQSWDLLEGSEEFQTDLRVVYYTYASALRLQPPRTYTCPQCSNELKEEFNSTELQCVACDFTHPIGLHVYKNMPPLPTSEIVEKFSVLGVSSGRLRNWKSRGKIRSYSDAGGENWFKPSDVLYLLGYMS